MRERLDFFRIDADGEYPRPENPAVGRTDPPASAHGRAQLVQEIVLQRAQVALGVDTHKVVGRQGFEQLPVAGQGDEEACGRQRRMQEKADAVFHAELAEHGGERDEVVVMHPDDVVFPQKLRHTLGKDPVDPQVPFQMVTAVVDEVAPIVEERPQRAVGKPAVVLVVVGFRHVDGGIGDGAIFHVVDRLACLGGDVATPAKPKPAHLLQCRIHGGRKSTRLRLLWQSHTV
ncbi:hypothetical protein ABIE56_000360 [Luteibacter sp. 621]